MKRLGQAQEFRIFAVCQKVIDLIGYRKSGAALTDEVRRIPSTPPSGPSKVSICYFPLRPAINQKTCLYSAVFSQAPLLAMIISNTQSALFMQRTFALML